MDPEPLVSCLCVSRPARWGQLQRAILDFIAQTYRNRELIIVTDQRTSYADLVRSFTALLPASAPVKVFTRAMPSGVEGLLGAMCQASGRIVTLWDDDNLNTPDRLANQVAWQTRFPGSITALTGAFYHFHDSLEVYLVSLGQPDAVNPSDRVMPSSLMAFRDQFPAIDGSVRAKPSELLVNQHVRAGGRMAAFNMQRIHKVGITYNNLRTPAFYREQAAKFALPVATLQQNHERIKEALSQFTWDETTIDICGRDGVAFTFLPTQRYDDKAYEDLHLDLHAVVTKDETIEHVHEEVSEQRAP